MGATKEFICFGHGPFEADAPLCPHGCTLVERRFFTPPAIRSNRTSNIDSTLDMVAESYGLTDLKNDGTGRASRVQDANTRKALNDAEQYNAMLRKRFGAQKLVPTEAGVGAWGGVQKGGTFRAGGGGIVNEGPGAPASMNAIHAPLENRLEEVKPSLTKPRVIYHKHKSGDKDLPKVA